MNNYIVKSSKHSIKDINKDKGIVTIKITDFDYFDSDNDRMMKGALNKTWKEGKQYHIVNHDLSTNSVVGVPVKKYADTGIIESKLNLNKDIGRNLFEDYKFFAENGQTLEHSHGFIPIKDKYKQNEKGGFDFHEIKQYEYSTVLYGAVDKTPLLGIKGKSDILTEIDMLYLKLQKGNYTDDYFLKIEDKLKTLQSFIKSPSIDTTGEAIIEPSNDTQRELKQFLTHLNL